MNLADRVDRVLQLTHELKSAREDLESYLRENIDEALNSGLLKIDLSERALRYFLRMVS